MRLVEAWPGNLVASILRAKGCRQGNQEQGDGDTKVLPLASDKTHYFLLVRAQGGSKIRRQAETVQLHSTVHLENMCLGSGGQVLHIACFRRMNFEESVAVPVQFALD